MPPARQGIVYLSEAIRDNEASPEDPGFVGHWESVEPPRLLETGPGWRTADAAIAWGRARADVVLIRIGMPGKYFSAGDVQPDRGQLPDWPGGDAAADPRV